MSHLTPHRSVRITPGGSAVNSPAAAGPPAVHDTSWGGLIADLAAAVGLEGPAASDFAAKVDDVVDAIAGYGDPEIARTRVRAALLGNTSMLTDLINVDVSPRSTTNLLDTWDQDTTDENNRVVARLALMHDGLVAPTDPSGHDGTVGEGSGGSAAPLPETESSNTVGQVAYTLDAVPPNAKDVIVWIGKASTEDDRRARAQAALEVEDQRPGNPRTTVARAIAEVLDG